MLLLNLDIHCHAFDISEFIPLILLSFDKNWLDRTKDRKGTWG